MVDESTQPLTPSALPPVLGVLHVADRDAFNRFGRMFRHLALALDEEGIRVSLLTDDAAAVVDLEGTPVQCHSVDHLRGWLAWRLGAQLTRRLESLPRVVHLWGTACLPSVGRWALSQDIAVLVHALSTGDMQTLARRRPRPNLHLAAACAGLVQMFPGGGASTDERFEVLAPAFLMPERSNIRPATEHTLGILWTGRMEPDAGLDTLVEAVAQIRRKGRDVQVALVGTGPALRSVWARIRQAQVHDCISLVYDPRAWDQAMRGVDVCVVPARQHELSLAPLLAMAYGKIVIASRDQVAEWFIEDQTAWQFTPESAVELAYHLTRAAEGERVARELRRSAAGYVRGQHTIGKLAARLTATYVAAVENQPVGAAPGAERGG